MCVYLYIYVYTVSFRKINTKYALKGLRNCIESIIPIIYNSKAIKGGKGGNASPRIIVIDDNERPDPAIKPENGHEFWRSDENLLKQR